MYWQSVELTLLRTWSVTCTGQRHNRSNLDKTEFRTVWKFFPKFIRQNLTLKIILTAGTFFEQNFINDAVSSKPLNTVESTGLIQTSEFFENSIPFWTIYGQSQSSMHERNSMPQPINRSETPAGKLFFFYIWMSFPGFANKGQLCIYDLDISGHFMAQIDLNIIRHSCEVLYSPRFILETIFCTLLIFNYT